MEPPTFSVSWAKSRRLRKKNSSKSKLKRKKKLSRGRGRWKIWEDKEEVRRWCKRLFLEM